MQLPAPLQVGAAVAARPAQAAAPQGASAPGNTHAAADTPSQRPSQVELPPQSGRAPRGRPVVGAQRPRLAGLSQASHWRSQALSQQIPSTQYPAAHSDGSAQGAPGPSFGTHSPAEQNSVEPQLAEVVQPPEHRVPEQVAGVQRWVRGAMQEPLPAQVRARVATPAEQLAGLHSVSAAG